MTGHDRYSVLGVNVSAVNMELALATIDSWIANGEKHYVCIRDVHGVMQSQRDETLRDIHNAAGMVTPDGMPLVWLSRLHGFKHVDRVYGPDLMLALCEHSIQKGYRHYFYGGAEGVAERLVERLEQRFPNLQVAGTYCPPFRPLSEAEDQEIIETINAAAPDIVWVGLGTPKQERWMAAHVGKLQAPVMVGVGAAFDFHAGLVKQAPRWIQRSGFEWLFRLMVEPRRLWKRYLVNNSLFIMHILGQYSGLKRYDALPLSTKNSADDHLLKK